MTVTTSRSARTEASGEDIAVLPSLGPTSARMLVDAGITDVVQLRELGVEKTYRLLRFHYGKRVTANFIYALEAATRGISWMDLEPERKAELRALALRIADELQRRAKAP